MTNLWTAHLDYWIEELSQPGRPITQADLDELKGLLSVQEQRQANARAGELEAEMANQLDDLGQQAPSELSETLKTLINNIRYTASIHLPISRKHLAKAEEHQHYINKDVEKAVEFYEAMPPDEKRFWDVEKDKDGDWNHYPRLVDKWSAIRPDLISPRARALLEMLERKRQQ